MDTRSILPNRDDFHHRLDIHPLAADLDFNGHINHVAIIRYFEHARLHDPLTKESLPKDVSFVLLELTTRFHKELKLSDKFSIGMRIIRMGTTSVTIEQALFRDNVCAATMICVFVKLDAATGKPSPINEEDITFLGL